MCTPELMSHLTGMAMGGAPDAGAKGGNITYQPGSVHKNILATLFQANTPGRQNTSSSALVEGGGAQGDQLGALASVFSSFGSLLGGGFSPPSGGRDGGAGGSTNTRPIMKVK